MPIFKESFGVTKDKVEVERYHLINRDGLCVCILTYGGIVQTLQAVDNQGIVADIVLGFDTLLPYLNLHPYFGAIIGRFANRIAYGKFTLEGKEYQLATNNGYHHLHGGLSGFDKQVWHASTIEVDNGSCLKLRHTSLAGDEGFPGTLTLETNYTWNDSNALRIDYSASTDAPTIINLTNHSYFNLAGIEKQSQILGHHIQLNASRYLPVDSTLIPTGEQVNVSGTCMDFCKKVCIANKLDIMHPQMSNANGGYDHAWVLDGKNNNLKLAAIVLAAIVDEPVSGRRMKVYTTQPAIQFYTGNFLDGSLIGKYNVKYNKYAGFCLETQQYPDAPNQPTFPTTVLYPSANFQQTTIYQLESYHLNNSQGN